VIVFSQSLQYFRVRLVSDELGPEAVNGKRTADDKAVMTR